MEKRDLDRMDNITGAVESVHDVDVQESGRDATRTCTELKSYQQFFKACGSELQCLCSRREGQQVLTLTLAPINGSTVERSIFARCKVGKLLATYTVDVGTDLVVTNAGVYQTVGH